ncbi:MAG TPA: hypothetical protein VKE27_09440, partial [Candidatus Dormibacteraeota bacterium]|nr:hypothetical protein [Candidatus Dormibacteraeota bacterium]
GLWSSQGATIGADGTVYIVSGNATSGGNDFSNSVIALTPDLRSVRWHFTPSNWASLNASDTDLGSVGAALLASGIVVAIGKEGVAYVIKSGGALSASAHVCSGAWGGTAWNGSTVYAPCADGLYALAVGDTSVSVAWRGRPRMASPIWSAGAVWAIEPSSATLFALDPSNGAVRFSTSLGSAMHFSTPAATDGFVVAPAGTAVVAVSVVS